MLSVKHYKVFYAIYESENSIPVRVILVNGLRLIHFFTKKVLKVEYFLHEVVRDEDLRSLICGTKGRNKKFEFYIRILVKVSKEKRNLRDFRNYIIFNEFYYREYAILIDLKIIYVNSEVLLDYRVYNFGLAIGFGKKGINKRALIFNCFVNSF
jgi:hypothetical protein